MVRAPRRKRLRKSRSWPPCARNPQLKNSYERLRNRPQDNPCSPPGTWDHRGESCRDSQTRRPLVGGSKNLQAEEIAALPGTLEISSWALGPLPLHRRAVKRATVSPNSCPGDDSAATHKRIAQVGHLERFNPAVRATVPLVTQPMFFEVHRLSVFTPRSLDVDVVLDLMIHDLDIVLAFAKSPVKEVRAVGLPILSGKVDIANVRLELESGCIANFTASRVSTERVRKLRFFQPRQYVSLDYGRQEVLVSTVAHDGGASGAPSVNPQIGVTKPPVASEEPLHAELKSFLRAVRERSTPVVPLEDGRRALALALEIVDVIRDHGKKVGLAGIAKEKL